MCGWSRAAASRGPLFDGFDNLYVGQPGAILSFPATQWTRWRQPVIGMPSTPRFLGGGQLLVATHLGQVLVFDAHRGEVVGSRDGSGGRRRPHRCDARAGRLRAGPAGLPGGGRARLLAGHRHGGARRLAAGRPGRGAGRAEVPPGADAAAVPGVDQRRRRRRSASPARCCPPTGRPSTSTAATNGCGRCTPPTAKPKWSVPLGFLAQTPPAVTPQGLIVSGGGPDTRLAAFKDAGDHADQVVAPRRRHPLSSSSLAGAGVGYTVVSARPTAHPVCRCWSSIRHGHTQQLSAPAATGYPSGCRSARSPVVAATSDGQVYGFAPTDRLSRAGEQRGAYNARPQPADSPHLVLLIPWILSGDVGCSACSSWPPTRAAGKCGDRLDRPGHQLATGAAAPSCSRLVVRYSPDAAGGLLRPDHRLCGAAGLASAPRRWSAAGPFRRQTASGGMALRGTWAWTAPANAGSISPGAK